MLRSRRSVQLHPGSELWHHADWGRHLAEVAVFKVLSSPGGLQQLGLADLAATRGLPLTRAVPSINVRCARFVTSSPIKRQQGIDFKVAGSNIEMRGYLTPLGQVVDNLPVAVAVINNE